MPENRRTAAIAARSADPSPRPRLPGWPTEAVDIRAAVREGMPARWGPLVCCALLAALAPYALAGAVDIPPAAAPPSASWLSDSSCGRWSAIGPAASGAIAR
jgi:hypothetical protein